MKKSFLLMFAAAGMLAACNNAETDSRIAQLEQRVTALEGGQPLQSSQHNAADHDHASHAANTAPEVQPQLVSDQQTTTPAGPTAKIEYMQTEYDWGTVKEGAIVNHVFKFKNTGTVPLIIQNAAASCGCTVPKKPEKPIAPGEIGEIEVRFDSSTRPGTQNKTITVTANTEPAISKLTIKGNVEPKAGAAASTGAEGPVRN